MTDKGFTDKVKGKAKEVVGEVTNDDSTKAEGLLDQAVGKAKEIASVHEEVKNGDLVVLVTGISETGTTNTFKIERIGE